MIVDANMHWLPELPEDLFTGKALQDACFGRVPADDARLFKIDA
jgi:hypothetical protein